MKEHIENNHLERHQANSSVPTTDEEWFNQFEDKPGMYDGYTTTELEAMKKEMLSCFKKKINELD